MRIQSPSSQLILLAFASSHLIFSVNAVCETDATSGVVVNPSTSNGCSYPACSLTPLEDGGNSNGWRCVHDQGFCSINEYFVSAAEVLASNRVCTCQDILDYPQTVGVCNAAGVMLPMVTESDCVGGTPLCPATTANRDGNTFLVGDDFHQFTACDLQCNFDFGHKDSPPEDTYHGCSFPSFEWATASTSSTGSMEANQFEIIGDTIFAGGSVWSFDDPTSDNFTPTSNDFTLTGPFTADDPKSTTGVSVDHDVEAYVGERRPYECAVAMIDKNTGKPIKVVSIVGPGTCYTNTLAKGTDAIVGAGDHAPTGHMSVDTDTCTAVEGGAGGSSTACADGKTTITADNLAYTGLAFSVDTSGNVKWLIQPWMELRDDLKAMNYSLYEISVAGSAMDNNGDVYISGYRAAQDGTITNPGNSNVQPNIMYYAMLSKHSGTDGSIIWEKEFPEARHFLNMAYDSSEDVLFVTAEIQDADPDGPGELGIICDAKNQDVEGCNALVRLSAKDGSVQWVRFAYGYFGRPWNHGDVHLAHPADGPYVYAAYVGVGQHGPTPLDLGTPYAGCKTEAGAVIPEYDPTFASLPTRLDQAGCTAAGFGTYFSSNSDMAIPAYAASTGAKCGGYGAIHCLVKYHKVTGKPVWGSVKPQIKAFRPQADGIIMTGGNYGPATFDTVNLAGPVGEVEGYDVIYQSKLDLNGNGIYAQPILADRSWAAGTGLTGDSATGDIFMGFFTSTDLTYLGPGAPGGFTIDLQSNTCGPTDGICEGPVRMVVTKLGQETTPSCIETCDAKSGQHVIKDGMCFIDQVCYSDKESGSRVGMPCLQCNPAASQSEWSEYTLIGTDFCYIDSVCNRYGDTYKIRTGRWSYLNSECQICDPTANKNGYSAKPGFIVDTAKDPPDDCKMMPQTVVGVAATAGSFTLLLEAATAAGLADLLNGDGPFTVFAPTDDAFQEYVEDEGDIMEDMDKLRALLKNHVVSGKALSTDLSNGQTIKTAEGGVLTVSISSDGEVKINNANVVQADVEATNGVIHVIDSVLEFIGEDAVLCPGQDFSNYCDCTGDCKNNPSFCSCAAAQAASCCDSYKPPENIVGVAVNQGSFTTLVKAAEAAGLVDFLSKTEGLTVFAPTDAAFAKIKGIDATIADSSKKDALASLLKNHVIKNEVYAKDLSDDSSILTAGGELLEVKISSDGVVTINNAKVVIADVSAYNGVIHAIDEVIRFDKDISSEEEDKTVEEASSSKDSGTESGKDVSSKENVEGSAATEGLTSAATNSYMSDAIIGAIIALLFSL